MSDSIAPRSWTGRLRRAAGLVLLLVSAGAVPVHAGSLGVAPTSLEFAPGEVAKGLSLRNTGDTVLQAQVRMFSWTQAEGEDVLEASTDLVASPPFLTIAPGAQQYVRVVRRGVRQGDGETRERSFRILVDELPPEFVSAPSRDAGGRDARRRPRPGINFVVRYSIPVFIVPAPGSAPAELRWYLHRTRDGEWRLAADNTGGQRARIAELELLDRSGRILFRHDGLAGYVLSGATRRWSFALPDAAAEATEIGMRINGQPARQRLAPTGAAR